MAIYLHPKTANTVIDDSGITPPSIAVTPSSSSQRPVVTLTGSTTVQEGKTEGLFTVHLSAPAPDGGLTIHYTLAGSTATRAEDFTLVAGDNLTALEDTYFTVAAGATTATLRVAVLADDSFDPEETLHLNLVPGEGYSLGLDPLAPFQLVHRFLVNSSSSAITTGDFNGDGQADLAIGTYQLSQSSGVVSSWLGNGKGGFQKSGQVSVSSPPSTIAIGDINGDGQADLATIGSFSSMVSLRLGNGDGSFHGTTELIVGPGNNSIGLNDFNGDGKSDLLVSSIWPQTSTNLRLGNGDGSFRSLSPFPLGSDTYAKDFNQDGIADLMVSNPDLATPVIWFGAEAGGFSHFMPVPSTNVTAVGDFNRDGFSDLIILDTSPVLISAQSIWLGDGQGDFLAEVMFSTGGLWGNQALADFNGDGYLDLATTSANTQTVSIWLNNAINQSLTIVDQFNVTVDGSFKQGQALMANLTALDAVEELPDPSTFTYRWQQSADGIAGWADIEGANSPTFVPKAAQVHQYVRVVVGYEAETAGLKTFASFPANQPIANSNVANDFNDDGYSDIVWRNRDELSTVVTLMTASDPQYSPWLYPKVDAHWTVQAVDDFDHNGNADLLWQHDTTGQAVIWLMSGINLLEGIELPDPDPNWQAVATGDFDGDQQTDILWRHITSGKTALWLMNGTTRLSGELLTAVPDLDWQVGAVGDFTQDGDLEILWQHRTSGETVAWRMEGTTLKDHTVLDTVEADWRMVGAADFTDDGQLDLLWQHRTAGEMALWQMDGLTKTDGQILSSYFDYFSSGQAIV